MKTPLRLLIGMLVVSLLLAACGGDQPEEPVEEEPVEEPAEEEEMEEEPAEEEPAEPQVVEQGVLAGPVVLDPANAPDNESNNLANGLVYETLVNVNDGNPTPGIASSWIVSDDLLDYIFTIDPDAMFADGTPITPEIIIANFNRWANAEGDGEYAVWLEVFGGFKGELNDEDRPVSTFDDIEKQDELTVILHLNRPTDDLLQNLARPAFSIVNVDSADDIVASGPYTVSSFTDSELLLVPNEAYWGSVPVDSLSFPIE